MALPIAAIAAIFVLNESAEIKQFIYWNLTRAFCTTSYFCAMMSLDFSQHHFSEVQAATTINVQVLHNNNGTLHVGKQVHEHHAIFTVN